MASGGQLFEAINSYTRKERGLFLTIDVMLPFRFTFKTTPSHKIKFRITPASTLFTHSQQQICCKVERFLL